MGQFDTKRHVRRWLEPICERHGVTVRSIHRGGRGRHWGVFLRKGTHKRYFSLPVSASDYRSLKNAEAEVKRWAKTCHAGERSDSL